MIRERKQLKEDEQFFYFSVSELSEACKKQIEHFKNYINGLKDRSTNIYKLKEEAGFHLENVSTISINSFYKVLFNFKKGSLEEKAIAFQKITNSFQNIKFIKIQSSIYLKEQIEQFNEEATAFHQNINHIRQHYIENFHLINSENQNDKLYILDLHNIFNKFKEESNSSNITELYELLIIPLLDFINKHNDSYLANFVVHCKYAYEKHCTAKSVYVNIFANYVEVLNKCVSNFEKYLTFCSSLKTKLF